jgi:hypothetical protein
MTEIDQWSRLQMACEQQLPGLIFREGFHRKPLFFVGIFPDFRVKFGVEKKVVLSNPEKALESFLALTQTTNKSLGQWNC